MSANDEMINMCGRLTSIKIGHTEPDFKSTHCKPPDEHASEEADYIKEFLNADKSGKRKLVMQEMMKTRQGQQLLLGRIHYKRTKKCNHRRNNCPYKHCVNLYLENRAARHLKVKKRTASISNTAQTAKPKLIQTETPNRNEIVV
eukprot:CAMPEP_0178895360 /NCGR_PEP_ID=MMETSP0786-20121207/544_1 /TAXON_ID=186022 /ORGANISM="Thalassionema frauenfeldii, Strain CCMP 1798" /LENGTH=144 /DNA_ID=CAMNT_0020565583 /DNA_START=1418 /DNA_END=1852 /DNA_ORIENTATION=-